MKIKILTDTSCGILREEANKLGYEMIALPFMLDDVEYNDDTISKAEFYDKLKNSNSIHTSQPSLEVIENAFDKILKDNDFIIYLPITSGLSSTYTNSLALIAEDRYKDKVISINHKSISVVQRGMLSDVSRLLSKGVKPQRIKELVEANAKNNRIYITVETLDYFKKGGRINPLAVTVGNLLNIKPVLFSNGGKFDIIKKARGLKIAEEEIKNLVLNDMHEFFDDEDINNFSIGIAYTENYEEANKFRTMMENELHTSMFIDELPSVVGCHIGAGAVACAIYKKINEL